jgi:hypothetical protein
LNLGRRRDCELQRSTDLVIADCDPGAAHRRAVPRIWPRVRDGTPRAVRGSRPGGSMLDMIFILATAAFFAVACAYVHGCDRV